MQRKGRQKEGKGGVSIMTVLAVVRIPTTGKSFFLLSLHGWCIPGGHKVIKRKNGK
jgi:hypothetical protein